MTDGKIVTLYTVADEPSSAAYRVVSGRAVEKPKTYVVEPDQNAAGFRYVRRIEKSDSRYSTDPAEVIRRHAEHKRARVEAARRRFESAIDEYGRAVALANSAGVEIGDPGRV